MVLTECFFNLLLEVSHIKYSRKIRNRIGKNHWDLETCRKFKKIHIFLKICTYFVRISWKILAITKKILSFFFKYFVHCVLRGKQKTQEKRFSMQKTKRDTWLDQYFFMNCIWLKNPFVTPFLNPTYLRLTIKVARWKPKEVSFIHYFLRAIGVQALLIFASSTFISKICIKYRKHWISYLSFHLFGQIGQ